MNQYQALVDTGATQTCLTYRAIGAEKLTRHGKRLVKNVHNQNLHGLYYANLGIFSTHRVHSEQYELEESYFGLEHPVELMDIADNERFDAILGMDILEHYNFRFEAGELTIDLR